MAARSPEFTSCAISKNCSVKENKAKLMLHSTAADVPTVLETERFQSGMPHAINPVNKLPTENKTIFPLKASRSSRKIAPAAKQQG